MVLGGGLGRMAGMLSERRRIIARKNLELCFPDKSEQEREALMRSVMASTGRGFFETGMAWFWPISRLEKLWEINGLEHFDAAKEQGVGVLLFSYHFTPLELGLAAINRHAPVTSYGVYRPHANKVYDYVMRKGRERHAHANAAIPRKDVRAIVKVLRKGGIVHYAPDQDYGRKYSKFVPFFGVEAATLVAPTQLAKLGRAWVFSNVIARKKDGAGYRIEIHPFEQYGEDESDDALSMNTFLAQRIEENPEQYLWVHRRFKSRPDNAPDFYGLEGLKSFQRRQRRRAKARQKRQSKSS